MGLYRVIPSGKSFFRNEKNFGLRVKRVGEGHGKVSLACAGVLELPFVLVHKGRMGRASPRNLSFLVKVLLLRSFSFSVFL